MSNTYEIQLTWVYTAQIVILNLIVNSKYFKLKMEFGTLWYTVEKSSQVPKAGAFTHMQQKYIPVLINTDKFNSKHSWAKHSNSEYCIKLHQIQCPGQYQYSKLYSILSVQNQCSQQWNPLQKRTELGIANSYSL